MREVLIFLAQTLLVSVPWLLPADLVACDGRRLRVYSIGIGGLKLLSSRHRMNEQAA